MPRPHGRIRNHSGSGKPLGANSHAEGRVENQKRRLIATLLASVDYEGNVALEYEGNESADTAVRKSIVMLREAFEASGNLSSASSWNAVK
jgi:hypothetical protein